MAGKNTRGKFEMKREKNQFKRGKVELVDKELFYFSFNDRDN